MKIGIISIMFLCVAAGCSWVYPFGITRIDGAATIHAARLDKGRFRIEEGLLFDAGDPMSGLISLCPGRVTSCSMKISNLSNSHVTVRKEYFRILSITPDGEIPLETEFHVYSCEDDRYEILSSNPAFSEPIILEPGQNIGLSITCPEKNSRIERPAHIRLAVTGIKVGDKEVSFTICAEE